MLFHSDNGKKIGIMSTIYFLNEVHYLLHTGRLDRTPLFIFNENIMAIVFYACLCSFNVKNVFWNEFFEIFAFIMSLFDHHNHYHDDYVLWKKKKKRIIGKETWWRKWPLKVSWWKKKINLILFFAKIFYFSLEKRISTLTWGSFLKVSQADDSPTVKEKPLPPLYALTMFRQLLVP